MNEAIGLIMIFVVLAFLVVFVWVTFRIFKVLIRAVWTGRAGLNPQSNQGRLRLFAIVCLVAAFALIGVVKNQGFDVLEAWATLGLILAACAFVYLGIKLFQRAKRLDAPSCASVLSEDKRAPVLYLRSFEDDRKVARRGGLAGFKLNTEEEDIAEIVNSLGPFVAIGRPGETLPYSGAARLYVGEGDWHERVRMLLSVARLVILRAGDTPGLWWEVEESAKIVRPEKLVFLVPLTEREYDNFRRKAENYLPCRLPEYTGRKLPATTIRAVLYFDSDWTPRLFPVQETYLGYWGRVFLTFPLFTPFVLLNNFVLRKQSHTRRVLDKTFTPILQGFECHPTIAGNKSLATGTNG